MKMFEKFKFLDFTKLNDGSQSAALLMFKNEEFYTLLMYICII